MSLQPSIRDPVPLKQVFEDGFRILIVLTAWWAMAAIATYGIGDLGHTGSYLQTYGPRLGAVFTWVGLLNAVLYLMYLVIERWHDY